MFALLSFLIPRDPVSTSFSFIPTSCGELIYSSCWLALASLSFSILINYFWAVLQPLWQSCNRNLLLWSLVTSVLLDSSCFILKIVIPCGSLYFYFLCVRSPLISVRVHFLFYYTSPWCVFSFYVLPPSLWDNFSTDLPCFCFSHCVFLVASFFGCFCLFFFGSRHLFYICVTNANKE